MQVKGELDPIIWKINWIGGELDVGDPKGSNLEVEIPYNYYTTTAPLAINYTQYN